MNIKPFGDRILIEITKNSKTDSGFELADTNVINETGAVVAIGPDVKTLKVGDTIMFKAWGLDTVEMDGKKYSYLRESAEFIMGTM